MEEKKIQWHPGFVAAMGLEFKDNKQDLIFEKEHNLNTKPLEVDLLVIKKDASVRLANEIGAFFRGHNIMEYKSPNDRLDIDVFYKTIAYAGLYKSYGRTLDERKADDITVSILREAYPRELFQYFRNHGFSVDCPFPGIYYIEGDTLFPVQVVVTKKLDQKAHAWLKALSAGLKKEDMEYLLGNVRRLTETSELEMADCVLEVSLKANKQMVQELIGDGNMYEALMELMEPQLTVRDQTKLEEGLRQGRREGRREGRQEGLRKGIRGTVDALRKFGVKDEEIKMTIIENYGISEEDAKDYL